MKLSRPTYHSSYRSTKLSRRCGKLDYNSWSSHSEPSEKRPTNSNYSDL